MNPSAVDPIALRRKVAWRILPLVVVLYIVSYLDRAWPAANGSGPTP